MHVKLRLEVRTRFRERVNEFQPGQQQFHAGTAGARHHADQESESDGLGESESHRAHRVRNRVVPVRRTRLATRFGQQLRNETKNKRKKKTPALNFYKRSLRSHSSDVKDKISIKSVFSEQLRARRRIRRRNTFFRTVIIVRTNVCIKQNLLRRDGGGCATGEWWSTRVAWTRGD